MQIQEENVRGISRHKARSLSEKLRGLRNADTGRKKTGIRRHKAKDRRRRIRYPVDTENPGDSPKPGVTVQRVYLSSRVSSRKSQMTMAAVRRPVSVELTTSLENCRGENMVRWRSLCWYNTVGM